MAKETEINHILNKYLPSLNNGDYYVNDFRGVFSLGNFPTNLYIKLVQVKDLENQLKGVKDISINIDLDIEDIKVLYGLEEGKD
jgi:hypothetical protein